MNPTFKKKNKKKKKKKKIPPKKKKKKKKKSETSIFRTRCTIQFWLSGIQDSRMESCIPVSYTE